ncbi:MAG TPA: hypothetical protein VFJ17_03510 [Mycobacteriales bacterium]|nr:hypothetical protein [Mycobacteriales bacterium]
MEANDGWCAGGGGQVWATGGGGATADGTGVVITGAGCAGMVAVVVTWTGVEPSDAKHCPHHWASAGHAAAHAGQLRTRRYRPRALRA